MDFSYSGKIAILLLLKKLCMLEGKIFFVVKCSHIYPRNIQISFYVNSGLFSYI